MPVPYADSQRLSAGQIVEMFMLDATALGDAVYRFFPGRNEIGTTLVWQGNQYTAFPIDAAGFEWRGSGPAPRPKLRVANVTALVGALCRTTQDLVGAKLTRKRTFAKYLDAVNFPGGVNPTADPNAAFADDVYFVERKSAETNEMVEFELASAIDLEGVRLPRRVVVRNLCPWVYRSGECGYTGGPVAKADDTLTSDPAQDRCGKRIASCELRFGATGELPFGGFPSVGLLRQ